MGLSLIYLYIEQNAILGNNMMSQLYINNTLAYNSNIESNTRKGWYETIVINGL